MDAARFAESIRQATLQAAISAYEDAGVQGLCEEGRWEAAVGAMRALDLRGLTGGGTRSPESTHPERDPYTVTPKPGLPDLP